MKILLILFILSIQSLFPTTIRYNDLEIERGNNYSLAFIIEDGFEEKTLPLEIEFDLSYNAFMIDPTSISGQNIELLKFQKNINNNEIRNSQLKFKIKVNSINEQLDTLFYFQFESLASQDSISQILLKEIKINNEVNEIEYFPNNIRTKNLLLSTDDYIGEIYPNPFNYNSKVDFTIYNKTKIDLAIHTIDAKSMNYNIENNYFQIEIYKKNGEKILFENGMEIEEGNYELVLFPQRSKISSGAYQLRMSINGKFYYKNFIFGG